MMRLGVCVIASAAMLAGCGEVSREASLELTPPPAPMQVNADIVVNISANGDLSLDGTQMTLEELVTHTKAHYSSDDRLMLSASSKAKSGRVVEVRNAFYELGFDKDVHMEIVSDP